MMRDRDNACFLKQVIHTKSGKQLYFALLVKVLYVETMELDGPKLILDYKDSESYIKDECQIKESDELSVDIADDDVSESRDFTVLAIKMEDENVHIECIATPTYNLKKISDKTKIFSMRGIMQILQMICQGLMPSLSSLFAINNNYHILAGERPSTMLRQIGKEQGTNVWSARGKLNIEKFAKLYAASPKFEFHHGQVGERNIIVYEQPAGQRAQQEQSARTFTGWDEKLGRIQTPTNSPLLKGVKSKPVEITGSNSKASLNVAPIARKSVIRFVTEGDLQIQPGDALSLVWHLPNPEEPIDESMPAKVVASRVVHMFTEQTYFTTIRGDVAFVAE